MNLAWLLKRWREAEGLSMREAAFMIGITHSALCRIENGKEISAKNLITILTWILMGSSGIA